MKKTKKKNNDKIGKIFISLLVALGIFFIIGLVFLSFMQKDDVSSYFTKDSVNSSEKIYNSLINLTEDNYPESPEKVVELYTESYKLLYGDRIKKEHINNLVPTILEKQRILFSDKLIIDNPIEEQTLNVKNNINFFQNEGLKIVFVELKPVIYNQEDPQKAYVNVVFQDNSKPSNDVNSHNYYYKYYLSKDRNGKWRITGFYPTDSEFNLIKR